MLSAEAFPCCLLFLAVATCNLVLLRLFSEITGVVSGGLYVAVPVATSETAEALPTAAKSVTGSGKPPKSTHAALLPSITAGTGGAP